MEQQFRTIWTKLNKTKYLCPFWSAIIVGLLTHMPVMVNKFPNSDAMTNFWFDQNMVTSGRWFLGVACGISSFYDLNWIIGILSLLYLGVTAVFLCEVLEVRSNINRGLVAALLVTFPAICATFAYLYTLDGYMIGLMLSVLAVYFAKKSKAGFAIGALCLGFSLGIYQAYLAVTMLLCVFYLIKMCLTNRSIKEMWLQGLKFLGMGVAGGGFYYIMLQICLKLQDKTLDSYQGISEMGKISLQALPGMIVHMIRDFGAFALKGNVLVNNGFSFVIVVLLGVVAISAALFCYLNVGEKRRWGNLLLFPVFLLLLPVATNVILLLSGDAYYHLLMRVQWGLYPIFALCFVDYASGYIKSVEKDFIKTKKGNITSRVVLVISCVAALASAGLSYSFMVTDNIAYFNMNERYERTYAYCLRLLDRMEQTEGYEPGMKVAMIGVVDENTFPNADITFEATSGISGTGGNFLLYKGSQYAAFMAHYMNVTFPVVEGVELVEIYNSDEYRALNTFPGENSMKVVNGILYIKTEAKVEDE